MSAVAELAADPRFVAQVRGLASTLGRDADAAVVEAHGYLEEMATSQQRIARGIWTRWATFLHRAYELQVDSAEIARLRQLSAAHPLVYLPSHRSNLDGYVMASLLHKHGLPANHTIGGINMAFWPIGPLGRRVGVIWIRRSFRDNEVYKLALRSYLGFLASRRLNLEWYIEGGRSRTGKLLPPRLGLFNYLADAVEELGLDDLRVIPVSIVYDALQEVGEMTSESRGTTKQAEGLGWLLRFAREQRGSYGAVHVNFGEPLVLADALRAATGTPANPRLARSKAAFEVCTRINRATPVTATSLATLALLGVGDGAQTIEEVRATIDPLLWYVEARSIPGHEHAARLRHDAGLRDTLCTLEEHGVVEHYAGGPESVFRIGPDHELIAAFYRNATIHWFLNRAIVELALLRSAVGESEDPPQAALDDAFALRDLLKFEFFFAEKDEFRLQLRDEMLLIDPAWNTGPDRLVEIGAALRRSGALMAHRVLPSFVESYGIVADHLAACGDRPVDPADATVACLRLGRQYRLQRRVSSAESVSTHLFASGLKLAANRDLLESAPDVRERREGFAEQIADVLTRLRQIDAFDKLKLGADALGAGGSGVQRGRRGER